MPASEFYEVGPLAQIAINLFYGWGYNFYRRENQLRADDLLIRSKASGLLGEARAQVSAAESELRRTRMAPPTREKPFPDAAVIADAQNLERLASDIDSLAGHIRAAAAPASDRMSELYRREGDVLVALADIDQRLIGQAELLRLKTQGAMPDTLLAQRDVMAEGIAAIRATLRERDAILLAPA
jgi:hypothetical protein